LPSPGLSDYWFLLSKPTDEPRLAAAWLSYATTVVGLGTLSVTVQSTPLEKVVQSNPLLIGRRIV